MSGIILDLCAGSGAWSQPYLDAGYDVRRSTLPNQDVRLWQLPRDLPGSVQGILAAPPCTHLARSGARWWKAKGNTALLEAMSVVDACLRIILITKPTWWALENPVGRLWNYLGQPQFTFDPYEFGDPWTKRTCLWGEFTIPKKNPVIPAQGDRTSSIGPQRGRSDKRSITPPGFAKSFFEANP